MLLVRTKNAKTKYSATNRQTRGSGIVEGVIGVMLIIGGTILAVLLLLNTGVATYNREKIGFIANQAATYAASLTTYGQSRNSSVKGMVNSLMTDMGLQGSNTNVKVSDVTVNNLSAVSVTVSSNLPTLISSGFSTVLPQNIKVTDTAVMVRVPYAAEYVVAIDPFGGKAMGPMINHTGALPADSLQAWSLSLINGTVQLR